MAGIRAEYHMDLREPLRATRQLQDLDLSELADEIGDYVLSETLINFDRERMPEGEAWEPSQRAQEGGGKTLQDRGHLRDSYTYLVGLGGGSVEIGSNMIYAAIHHFGGETGRDHALELPARPALGITPEMEAEISELAVSFASEPLG